jgi:hypothetical protein
MSFEHFREPLRRAFAHAVTLAAARKIIAAFGGRLSTGVEDVGRAAERVRVADDVDLGESHRP